MSKVPVITIIDDDESVRTATRSLIRSLGYVAQTFASAEEFLKSPRACSTSCIISDVHMPDMDGLELQRCLTDRGCDTPIIFITAFPDSRIEARALNAGAVCILNKPVDGPTLLNYLAYALQGSEDTSAED